jgi:alpha-L-fucosidase 2
VQSHEDEVRYLPALPDAWKKHGRIEGIRLRGGKTVKVLEWRNGEIVKLEVV